MERIDFVAAAAWRAFSPLKCPSGLNTFIKTIRVETIMFRQEKCV
jgi:hypothetical protein